VLTDGDDEKPEMRDKYGRHTFGQSLLMARRLIEAGSRVVQVNWPAVANGNPTAQSGSAASGPSRTSAIACRYWIRCTLTP